uniref:Putative portal protein n=2 Tax=viral metagenome TaxID=1070528 RepID=A0A6M3M287_9ZZZZ
MGLLQEAAKAILRDELSEIRRDYGTLAENGENLRETITELQLQLEDAGWTRLSGYAIDQFNRQSLGTIAELSRVLYLKNPLIQRGANVKRLYVWGQGVNVEAEDPDINMVIQDFIDDRRNRLELTSHQARMLKEIDLQVDGNLFLVLFTNPSTGAVKLASIPFSQMQEIVSNPEDAKEPWYYLRSWIEKTQTGGERHNVGVQTPKKAYYPDWQYGPVAMHGKKMGDVEVRWDGLIYHVKVGSFSDWTWGVSEHYAAQDWAKAYKEFLEDWASIVRSYRRFAWRFSGAKSKGEITAIKSKMGTTIGTGTSETNPPPVTGAAAVLLEGRDLQPIRTAGATVAAEDGRRLLLMVAAAEGLPETFFGDVSVGTLATAKTMDRPTELAMKDRQMLWADIHRDLFNFVLLQQMKAPSGELHKLGRYVKEPVNGQYQEWVEWKDGVDPSVTISFPSLLERDVESQVKAIATGATLDGKMLAGTIPHRELSRMVLTALNAEDIDEMLDQLDEERLEQTTEGGLVEAARELRDGMEKLIKDYAGGG